MYDFEVGQYGSVGAVSPATRARVAALAKRRALAVQRARALASQRARAATMAAKVRAAALAKQRAAIAAKAAAVAAQKAKARGATRAAQAHAANAARKKARTHLAVRTVQAARAGSETAKGQLQDTMIAAQTGDAQAQDEASLMGRAAQMMHAQENFEPEEALDDQTEALEEYEGEEEDDSEGGLSGEVSGFEVGAFGWLKKGFKKIGKAVKSVVRSKLLKYVAGAAAIIYPPVGIPAAAALAASNKVLDAAEKGNKNAKKLIKNTLTLAKKGDKEAQRGVKLLKVTLKGRRDPVMKAKLLAIVKRDPRTPQVLAEMKRHKSAVKVLPKGWVTSGARGRIVHVSPTGLARKVA